jgi:4-alpha-glucanotransferase
MLPPFPPGFRASGVPPRVSSLRLPYGLGDIGPAALARVDLLHKAGQSWSQALPLVLPDRTTRRISPCRPLPVLEIEQCRTPSVTY